MLHCITDDQIVGYQMSLEMEERAKATIEKYERDLRAFLTFLGESRSVDKQRVIAYKSFLQERYAPTSINSMLAAVNGFLSFVGWHECRVKPLKIQRRVFCDEGRELTKAEYGRLVQAAKRRANRRLMLVMETICATGIRVSELAFITKEAVAIGRASVRCKGKSRTVFLPKKLCALLRSYMREQCIKSGSVFVTRGGKPLNRSNIWHEMKALCRSAGVSKTKVFPHNLRHLFARTYYSMEKDLGRLADLLGHNSVETTRIYTMTTGDEHEKQVALLGLIV